MVDPPKGARAKQFGAYYTDERIADFLVHWAIRSHSDKVIDPSFGGGVFLEAAIKRLEALGGEVSSQVYGVEIDEQVHGQIAYELSLLYDIRTSHLLRKDFFELDSTNLPPLDAVVGNPPFIRYQRFSGNNRRLALRQVEKQGLTLNKLVSSWTPFLIHSCTLLKRGGRLAMVIPVEIGHAAYARPVLTFIVENFERTTLLTFKERLFPTLNQDTLLLLAENKDGGTGDLLIKDLDTVAALEDIGTVLHSLTQAEKIDPQSIIEGHTTLASCWISQEARALYKRLVESQLTKRLGDIADVGIGYVTGANKFFHLNKQEAKENKINKNHLTPAVYRGRAFEGIRFSKQDWQKAEKSGEAGFLLDLAPQKRLSEPLKTYISEGEQKGINKAYKCRARTPWYSVPHVHQPDAFLTYMSGSRPMLVTNDAGVVAPNSLHMVRLRPGEALTPRALALLWQSSLTSLSVELEGHALGGGMLKLEPSEARSVLVPDIKLKEVEALGCQVDHLLREGREEEARDIVDEIILERHLDLTKDEIRLLRESAGLLRQRRYKRGVSAACSQSSPEPAESSAQRP